MGGQLSGGLRVDRAQSRTAQAPVCHGQLPGAELAVLLLKAAVGPLQHHRVWRSRGVQPHAVLPGVDDLRAPPRHESLLAGRAALQEQATHPGAVCAPPGAPLQVCVGGEAVLA